MHVYDDGMRVPCADDSDAIITDQLNHASIIDGVRLCKAQRHVYKHMDLVDLEAKLIQSKGEHRSVNTLWVLTDCRRRMIVTDGVFSMDGDVAPLMDISRLAKQHNALLFVDECHATGLLGTTGRGTEQHLSACRSSACALNEQNCRPIQSTSSTRHLAKHWAARWAVTRRHVSQS
jgi:7-keto-8-aminopelargonate synthetase-like enzyme